jgi:hypothetical protein
VKKTCMRNPLALLKSETPKQKTIISKNCDLTTAIVETPKKKASRVMKSAIRIFELVREYVYASLVVVGDGEVVSPPKKSPTKLRPIHPDAQIDLDDIKKKRKRTD